jgi:hypothetical protein
VEWPVLNALEMNVASFQAFGVFALGLAASRSTLSFDPNASRDLIWCADSALGNEFPLGE